MTVAEISRAYPLWQVKKEEENVSTHFFLQSNTFLRKYSSGLKVSLKNRPTVRNFTNYFDGFAEDDKTILATHKTFQVFSFGGNFVIKKTFRED